MRERRSRETPQLFSLACRRRRELSCRRRAGGESPGCVREILRRERYRGVYRHGLIHRVRRGGKRVVVASRADEVIAREIPEWRIVDDSIWFRVQELTTDRRRDVRAPGPAARYPLSGIGRCGSCGGAIGVARTTRGTDRRVPAYACTSTTVVGTASAR